MQKFLLIMTLIISVLYVRVLTYPELELNKQEFFKASNVLTINNHCCNNTKFPLIATAGAITGEVFTGFTLAEVLITLLIIGVVASLVIPALIQDTQEAELHTAWKKVYSDIDQATKRISIDNGGSLENISIDDNGLRNTFLPYLSYIKACNSPNNIGNCWHKMDGSSKNLKGESITGWTSGSGIILNNSCLLRFRLNQPDCKYTGYGIPICGHITIDVNGFKGPNVTGKDIFAIYIQKNSVKPWGVQGDIYQNDCNNLTGSIPGMGCSAVYLYQ